MKLSPLAVMVGQDEDNIDQFYVAINRNLYEVDNGLKAFHATFKSLHALDTAYNREVEREFTFIERAVYDIMPKPSQKSAPHSKTAAIIQQYKNFKL
jgi:hypothetical protein